MTHPHWTPAPHMPWTVKSPFRMQPGLSRLEPAATPLAAEAVPPTGHEPAPALFVRDAQALAYQQAKRQALLERREHCQLGAADPAVLQLVADAYAQQTGVALPASLDGLSTGMQEDFVILHDEAGTLRTRCLSVCFPSNWMPAEKINADFAAIHAPVADNALLQAAGAGIMDMAFRKARMQRHVWLLTPGGELAQHPHQRMARWDDALRAADAAGQPLLSQAFFRVERQTTWPLPALARGVFFIRVMVAPLQAVLAVAPGRAAQLHEALRSMSDAVVAYRGMATVRERLCRELAQSA